MRRVDHLCGEGCLNVLEGPWYWHVVFVVLDNLPGVPFRLWGWAYDHLRESTWQPGHIGEEASRE